MRNRRAGWLSGLGAVVLIGGLLAGCGSGDDVAVAQSGPADLHGVMQNWDKVISGTGRFTVLSAFGQAAVRDNETGLVWEQAPDRTARAWVPATSYCINKNVGGRRGWRLPSIAELSSLIDPAVVPPGPTLPPGHPFTNVQTDFYWSASSLAGNPSLAWFVAFGLGSVDTFSKTGFSLVWCVRGGMNADQY